MVTVLPKSSVTVTGKEALVILIAPKIIINVKLSIIALLITSKASSCWIDYPTNIYKHLPPNNSWGNIMEKEPKTHDLPLLRYLEEKGITLQELIDTALELFVPHPGVEDKEKATRLLKEEFLEALSDVNVSCFEVACFKLEEEAKQGLVPGLTVERFMGRPGLVADELLGITIANYIAGAKGIFEFIRFDQAKPGILKKLGPITNDAIGGLIAGVSSNMYTRALSQKQGRHNSVT